ncbi:MAG TPA: oxidoreductase, partial [Pseudolysinimonas sp.]|nr:oxidoreductase [Pseudolysinimonas sp.]
MSSGGPDGMELVVESTVAQTHRVRSFILRRPDGGRLPSFTPGSHVVVHTGGRRNAYSLTGPASAPSFYSISVLRLDGGLGGSVALHELTPGERVLVSHPRSAFAPVATARHHLLIAAGVGITPMLSHV